MTHSIGQVSFGPLLHSTVGFDDVFKDFDRILTSSKPVSYPPHNIYKRSEHVYVIEIAVAGYSKDELDITVEDKHLYIRGSNTHHDDDSIQYIHKGISNKAFTKKIKLLDTIKVVGADYKDGMLIVTLENVIPEEKRPIKIQINDHVSEVTSKQLLTE